MLLVSCILCGNSASSKQRFDYESESPESRRHQPPPAADRTKQPHRPQQTPAYHIEWARTSIGPRQTLCLSLRLDSPVLAGIFRGSASDSTGIARIAGSHWIAGSRWIAHVTRTHKNRPPGRPERPRSPHTYPACTPHVPYACAPHALLTRLLVLRRAVRVRAAAADLRLPPHLGGTPRFGGGGIKHGRDSIRSCG